MLHNVYSRKNNDYRKNLVETILGPWNEFNEISEMYNDMNVNSFQFFHKDKEAVITEDQGNQQLIYRRNVKSKTIYEDRMEDTGRILDIFIN